MLNKFIFFPFLTLVVFASSLTEHIIWWTQVEMLTSGVKRFRKYGGTDTRITKIAACSIASLPRPASFPHAARLLDSTDELYIAEQKREPFSTHPSHHLSMTNHPVRNLHRKNQNKKNTHSPRQTWTLMESRVYLVSSLRFCWVTTCISLLWWFLLSCTPALYLLQPSG